MRILKIFITISFFSPHLCHVFCQDYSSNDSSAVVAVILARGGSKGIKMKNIQTIEGVSLLGISLTEIQKVGSQFQSVWVSTDSEDIAREAEKCKCCHIAQYTYD
jgi:Cytidylyltransferase